MTLQLTLFYSNTIPPANQVSVALRCMSKTLTLTDISLSAFIGIVHIESMMEQKLIVPPR